MSDTSKNTLTEQYISQVSESVQGIFELTTRIDERMKALREKQEELERKIDAPVVVGNTLTTKVTLIEDKIRNIDSLSRTVDELREVMKEFKKERIKKDERWKNIVQFGLQIISGVIIAYLLYKLHIAH